MGELLDGPMVSAVGWKGLSWGTEGSKRWLGEGGKGYCSLAALCKALMQSNNISLLSFLTLASCSNYRER